MPSLRNFKFKNILISRNKSVAFDLVFYSGGVEKQGGMGRGAPRSRPTGKIDKIGQSHMMPVALNGLIKSFFKSQH